MSALNFAWRQMQPEKQNLRGSPKLILRRKPTNKQTSKQSKPKTNTQTNTHTHRYISCRAATPPLPPHPMVSPLVVVLFGLVAFPVWSCLASSPPPAVEWGLWSFWLAPPRLRGAVCSTEVWYGCCRLLVVMSSLRALSPPPLWGGACGRFGWPRPACVGGSVFYRDMVCDVLVTIQNTKYDVALFSLQTVPLSLL